MEGDQRNEGKESVQRHQAESIQTTSNALLGIQHKRKGQGQTAETIPEAGLSWMVRELPLIITQRLTRWSTDPEGTYL